MDILLQDLRFGVRMLVKNPGFTIIAVLTLALGIGANTAIFSVVNAVLLRPLPYYEPDRIMALWPDWPESSFQGVSESKFVFWREHSQSFEGIAATQGVGSGVNLWGGSEPEFVPGLKVSADFFRVLGVNPALGRGFAKEEDAPGGERVVIISDSLWRRRFGADPSLVGRSVAINGEGYTVVGVMAPGFQYSSPADVMIPTRVNPASREGGHNYRVLGRLKPGVTREQALVEMRSIFEQFKAAYPNMLWQREGGIKVEPLLASLAQPVREPLLILLGAVSLVLLIACANVANLQLTRAAARRKELAVRQALGASWSRIARQLLIEGLLLALVGGGAGLLLALWGAEALAGLIPEGMIPPNEKLSFDWRVLAFTLGASVVTGLLFALAPALRAARVDVNDAIKEGGGKGAVVGSRGGLHGALVVAEVALALVLLVGAALLIRTLTNLYRVEPGFNPHHVLTFEVAPNGMRYSTTAGHLDYFRRALERIESLPGVEAAAVTSNLPLGQWLNLGVEVVGRPESLRSTEFRLVTPEFFGVMRMSVRRGRDFTEADSESAEPVAIVNEAYVRQRLANAAPLIQRISVGRRSFRVVGVVNDVKQFWLGEAAPPMVFVPLAQVPDNVMRVARQFVTMKFTIRTAGDPSGIINAVRQEMSHVDASLPVANVRTLEQIVSRSLARERFNTMLLALFACIGLALSAVGIYGVISYHVAQRTREIGVRRALGAQNRDVLRLVVVQGMRPALIGVALGLAGSFALSRLMSSLLFGVGATDPATFALIALLLMAVALLACYVPARRAAKVDPMVALRYE